MEWTSPELLSKNKEDSVNHDHGKHFSLYSERIQSKDTNVTYEWTDLIVHLSS